MTKLHILTLNFNGRDKLQKLYPTLISSLQNIEWQWLIKDNGSKDNSVDLEKEWNNNNIHIIPFTHNRDNFSQGCNFLYKEASPKSDDLILLLNNDIVFNDHTSLQNMINIIQNDDAVGVVGARLLYSNTNKIQHAGVVFIPNYNTPMHFRVNQIADDLSEKNREFQAVTGAVMLTKAKYYENICTTNKSGINGLDQKLNWAFDDTCACLAIKYNMKKKIVYCGQTYISHEESATLKKNPVNKLFLSHNLNYLFNTWRARYIIDSDEYVRNPLHNLYRGKEK